MSLIQLFNFDLKSDERGCLVAVEESKDVPFQIKRIYYLNNLQSDAPRGFHAHKNLQQVAICLQGSCLFIMDDGINRQQINLTSSAEGLFINKMIWHEMHHFTPNCLLLLLASDYYEENDYIRNYEEFVQSVRNA